jgi:CBS domain-containing protein
MRHRALCDAMLGHLREEASSDGGAAPVHAWERATLDDGVAALRDGHRTVGQFMSTDLFTVRPDDIVDLAASVMDWRHVRHVPVEDASGRLCGLVSHRALLRLFARGVAPSGATVESIMRATPITVAPETTTLDAMRTMREHGVGCLPVVVGDRLVGIVTERDLLFVAAKLLEGCLRDG